MPLLLPLHLLTQLPCRLMLLPPLQLVLLTPQQLLLMLLPPLQLLLLPTKPVCLAESHLRVVFLFMHPAEAYCWKRVIAANSRVAQCSKKWQSVLQGNTANHGFTIAILVVLARQGSGSAL